MIKGGLLQAYAWKTERHILFMHICIIIFLYNGNCVHLKFVTWIQLSYNINLILPFHSIALKKKTKENKKQLQTPPQKKKKLT